MVWYVVHSDDYLIQKSFDVLRLLFHPTKCCTHWLPRLQQQLQPNGKRLRFETEGERKETKLTWIRRIDWERQLQWWPNWMRSYGALVYNGECSNYNCLLFLYYKQLDLCRRRSSPNYISFHYACCGIKEWRPSSDSTNASLPSH